MQIRSLTETELNNFPKGKFKPLDKNGNLCEFESNKDYNEKELKKLFSQPKYTRKSTKHKILSAFIKMLKTKAL